MNKPTPKQSGTSNVLSWDICSFKWWYSQNLSLSFSLPLSLLFCCFWIITRKLHLGDNPNSKPMETGSWCMWTKLEGKGVSGEEFQEDKKDNGRQKSNSPSFSPSLNFQAKNILRASSRWRDNGLFAICRDKTAQWNCNLKVKVIRNRVK